MNIEIKMHFERCEMEIRDLINKHAFKFSMNVRTLRGIELQKWTSETEKQVMYEEHKILIQKGFSKLKKLTFTMKKYFLSWGWVNSCQRTAFY